MIPKCMHYRLRYAYALIFNFLLIILVYYLDLQPLQQKISEDDNKLQSAVSIKTNYHAKLEKITQVNYALAVLKSLDEIARKERITIKEIKQENYAEHLKLHLTIQQLNSLQWINFMYALLQVPWPVSVLQLSLKPQADSFTLDAILLFINSTKDSVAKTKSYVMPTMFCDGEFPSAALHIKTLLTDYDCQDLQFVGSLITAQQKLAYFKLPDSEILAAKNYTQVCRQHLQVLLIDAKSVTAASTDKKETFVWHK